MARPILMVLASTLFALSAPAEAQPGAQPNAPNRATALVQDLGEFPAALPGGGTGRADPTEERRRRVYDELLALGSAAIPALADGLADPDLKSGGTLRSF